MTKNTLIQNYAKTAPEKPGIYKMLNNKNTPIYIGKAKNLKRRLSQYCKPLSSRLQCMVSNVVDIDIVVTRTEIEALIMEASLIKSVKPKYNILLKDDKTFPFIRITKAHPFPRITQYKGSRVDGCFGPFLSSHDVAQNIISLQTIFLLRSCSDNNFTSRKRPCLEYQIKRCSAPCVGKISQEEYGDLVSQAQSVLNGKAQKIQQQMATAMKNASDNHEYEKAAIYRKRIRSMQAIGYITSNSIENGDTIVIHKEAELACAQVFFIKNSQICGNYHCIIDGVKELAESEIMQLFLMQFYQAKEINNLFLSCNIEKIYIDTLKYMAKKPISLNTPKRGEKFDIVQLALNSAKTLLQNKLSNNLKHLTNLQAIAKLFNLDYTPKRIEVYDNSHNQGSGSIGGMIVFGESGFMKSAYRKFNIKQSQTNDDCGMMAEVISRRLKRISSSSSMPDLIILDGGIGQISATKNIVAQYKIPLIAISKGSERKLGEERIILSDGTIIQLKKNDPVLLFLQRIRDEAHRFAITNHRKKMIKALTTSSLDLIPGIGKEKKKALLAHFGSTTTIKEASIAMLSQVPGIDVKIAERILTILKKC